MTDEKNDIFWHALNYRTAAIQNAEEMWLELNACVNRIIEAEREACAKTCDDLLAYDDYNPGISFALAIRMRSFVEPRQAR